MSYVLAEHEVVGDQDPAELLMRIYVNSGYEAMIQKEAESADREDFIDRESNISSLIDGAKEFAAEYERKKGTSKGVLEEYLTMIALVSDADAADGEEAVNMLTIHASKGMESDVVFIVGAEDRILPHAMADNKEEERRLMYVAASRARKHLHITRARWRSMSGSVVYNKRSPYIEEMKLEEEE